MSFLDSFIHGDSLTEILLEGHNPYALRKLDTADIDALRQRMHSSETLQGYVIGRVVGAGRAVWAVTDRAVLVLQAGRRSGVERVEMGEVEGFEAVRGRFGHVVRLHASHRSWSLFGVDRDLAADLHRAFSAKGIASRYEDKPARSHVWRQAMPAGWAQDCLHDARRRLHAG